MANITKLPSGNYRIRKMNNGKVHTLLLPYKPSNKEAELLLNEAIMKNIQFSPVSSFKRAGEQYIQDRSSILSPATIREYKRMLERLPDEIKNKKPLDISDKLIQQYINTHAKEHSPKSTKMVFGFIQTILSSVLPDRNIHVTLPLPSPSTAYTPEDEDIKRILAAIQGEEIEVAILLAIFGLRRSEICALEYPSDFEGNTIHITKGLVEDENKNWIKKKPKTPQSIRDITIPDSILEKIKAKGYVYKGFPGSINKRLTKILKDLKIPHFSLHKLRHYFASSSHALGIPDMVILRNGGWKTDNVMKSVYRHAQKDSIEKESQKYIDHLNGIL